jgi:hypothetical protein
MNQFQSIDAQDAISRLAQATTEETTPEAMQDAPAPVPRINHAKLTAHNLRQPLDKRINADELAEKLVFARMAGNLAGLLATIHAEITPQIDPLDIIAQHEQPAN